jgi:hypothetical protein
VCEGNPVTKPDKTIASMTDEDIRAIEDVLHFERYIHEDTDVREFLSLCDDLWVKNLLEDAHTPYPCLDDIPTAEELGWV